MIIVSRALHDVSEEEDWKMLPCNSSTKSWHYYQSISNWKVLVTSPTVFAVIIAPQIIN